MLHFFDEVGVLVGGGLHICDVEKDVGIDKGRVAELAHLLLQFVVGFEHAGGVGIDYLPVCSVSGAIDYTHDTMTRSLSFGCDDTKALTDESVHQC